ncbi:MAG TPA: SDR family oxidoreductase [Acidimicrobiales bacterium]|nr:SDR family oxidoreductase [Acidimicrobiales bacterium]
MRTALITGGSGGIGLACARLLVERGYQVVLTARRPGPLRRAAGEVGARWVAADSADPDALAAAVEAARPLGLLVHAAGTMAGTFVTRETVEGFDAVLRANLRSAFVAAHLAVPAMTAGSRMVFLSSSAAHAPQPGKAAYSASKAALNAFAAALAGEVDGAGISVHVVTPAPVATAMLDDVHFPMVPLAPADVAAAIVWLDQLPPAVVLPELQMRAVTRGPFAPEAYVPPAARARGRTTLPGT